MLSSALLVQIDKGEHGSYRINQVENTQICDPKNKNWLAFDLTVGIFTVSGYVHTVSLEAEVTLEVYNMTMGTFRGNPHHGFKINLDLSMVKGSVELQLNDFDELWLDVDSKVFQVSENGPGQFVPYRKTNFIRELPGFRCESWVSNEANHG